MQASEKHVDIYVIADGREHEVRLFNSFLDSACRRSLICPAKARASRGTIRSLHPTTITDHTGITYTSTSTIELRWYYADSLQTFSETFHIVDNLPVDAILRFDAEPPASALTPQVHAILPAPKKDPRRESEHKERVSKNQKDYEQQTKEQAKKIREAFEATKHPRPKQAP
jgi:hypothetical protein